MFAAFGFAGCPGGHAIFEQPDSARDFVSVPVEARRARRLRAIATTGRAKPQDGEGDGSGCRANDAKPLRVEELADSGEAWGFRHCIISFRALTAMSPVQYQKRLRLQIARERMLHGRPGCGERSV